MVNNFAANNVRDTDLVLTWSKPQAEKEIEKANRFSEMYSYRVTIKSDNQVGLYDELIVPSDQQQVKVSSNL